MALDLRSLRDTISKAKNNVAAMRKAILKEQQTIDEYMSLIGSGRYDDDRLRAGVDQAKLNIAKFERVIVRDQRTMQEHKKMIQVLTEREKIKDLAKKGGLIVEVQRDQKRG